MSEKLKACCKITKAGQKLGVIIASYTITSVYDGPALIGHTYVKPVESNN
jgi:hypothetical protein